MKENLELMAERGFTIPVICGGAALNRAYVEGDLSESYRTGEVYYGLDAFAGLHLMNELCGHTPQAQRVLTGPGRKKLAKRRSAPTAEATAERRAAEQRYAPSDVKPAPHVPQPPFWGSRVVDAAELKLAESFPYINKRALYRGQWQYRRGRRSEAVYRPFVAAVVEPKFHQWCARAMAHRMLEPRVVYGYFPGHADENELVVYRPAPAGEGDEWLRIRFPRQPSGRRLCLADFFAKKGGPRDVVAFQIVTMGAVASQQA